MEIPDQKRSWNREYKKRGQLWRGESVDKIDGDIISPALDNGCGNGKDIRDFRGVIGLDFSMNALLLYRKKNNMAVCGDMLHLPFKDSTFNTILFMHSLDHLLENERPMAIREAHRVLREKGKMILKVFSIEDFRFGKGKLIERNTFLRGNGIITHYFQDDELQFPCFEILEVKNIKYHLNIKGEKRIRNEILIKYMKL